jgi:hypothetical protein
MRLGKSFLVFVAVASAACGAGAKPRIYHPTADDPTQTVRIWIQDDVRMPKPRVMAGCAEWNVKRVYCIEVSDPSAADIRVYAKDEECRDKDPETKKDRTVLAWAFSGGDIWMMAKCIDTKDGVFDSRQLAGVVTHEIGHQFGIWEHVERSCDGVTRTHRSGKKICGVAVMNPYYDEKVLQITEIDAMAFDEHDPDHSVLVTDVPRKDTPDCVYYAPAPE